MEEKAEHDTLRVLTFQSEPAPTLVHSTELIQCVKCDKRFEFPTQKDDYLGHLFLEHRLVIADVDDVAEIEEYLKFWQNEFKDHEFEEYCTTMLLDQLPDGTPAKNEKYYLLSDVLPKDYEKRKQLQQQRLENALARHQFERTDRNFCKECLYCRDVITGLRADYLSHLFSKHFLQLGKPENLVYVDELVAKVQHNLEQLICLYCDKVFKDRVTLKEHMRKKAHKRINPNNREYDKFFLLNYRNEKPNQTVTKREVRQQRRAGQANDQRQLQAQQSRSPERGPENSVDFERQFGVHNDDDCDSDWSDWDDEQPPLNCLYCTHQELAFAALKQHMQTDHQVDFEAGVRELNFYQRIKVVNYVRRQICLQRCVTCNLRCETALKLIEHMASDHHFGLGTRKQWDKPEYFFPTYEDDGLLCILDDNANDEDDVVEAVVRIISEDSSVAQINKDAERLSLENFQF